MCSADEALSGKLENFSSLQEPPLLALTNGVASHLASRPHKAREIGAQLDGIQALRKSFSEQVRSKPPDSWSMSMFIASCRSHEEPATADAGSDCCTEPPSLGACASSHI